MLFRPSNTSFRFLDPELPSATSDTKQAITPYTGDAPCSTINATIEGSKRPLFDQHRVGFTSQNHTHRALSSKVQNLQLTKANRARKRKRTDQNTLDTDREDSDSDDVDFNYRSRARDQRAKLPKEHWLSSLLASLESRPSLPAILSVYAQLSLNIFFAILTMYGVWTLWTTIRADVDKAAADAQALLSSEIQKCSRHYTENQCAPDMRLPALEVACHGWEICMNRDPNSVGRARVSAHTFAQILNSFIEPVSYKAMVSSFSWMFYSSWCIYTSTCVCPPHPNMELMCHSSVY